MIRPGTDILVHSTTVQDHQLGGGGSTAQLQKAAPPYEDLSSPRTKGNTILPINTMVIDHLVGSAGWREARVRE